MRRAWLGLFLFVLWQQFTLVETARSEGLVMQRIDMGDMAADVVMRVGQLRCEYLQDPLGIDTPQPRLSWVLESGQRGQRQTAYEILVASSAELLAEDQGDLWQSGKVASDETAQVVYAGKPLGSRQACFWKVRAWDRQDKPSDWSPAHVGKWACWSPAIGRPIGSRPTSPSMGRCPSSARQSNWPTSRWPRRGCSPPRWASTTCTSTASPVGDHVFAPDWTDYRKRVRYQVYDVSGLLKPGENAIAALLAKGWYCGHIGMRRLSSLWKAAGPDGPARSDLCRRQRRADRDRRHLEGRTPAPCSPPTSWWANLRRPAGGAAMGPAGPGRQPLGGRRGAARVVTAAGRPGDGAGPPDLANSSPRPSTNRNRATGCSTSARTWWAWCGLRSRPRPARSDPAPRRDAQSRRHPLHRQPAQRALHRYLYLQGRRRGGLAAALHLPRLPLRGAHRPARQAGRRTR